MYLKNVASVPKTNSGKNMPAHIILIPIPLPSPLPSSPAETRDTKPLFQRHLQLRVAMHDQ